MIVKVFCMLKDEADILEDWLIYHGYLFGYRNLYLADNCSTDVQCRLILERYAAKGANVVFDVPGPQFLRKGDYLREWAVATCPPETIFLPLDVDEFLLYRRGTGKYTTNKRLILTELRSLPSAFQAFRITEALLSANTALEYQRPAREMIRFYSTADKDKHFFRLGSLRCLDRGFHYGVWQGSQQLHTARLVHLHFHDRGARCTIDKAINVVRRLGYNETDVEALQQVLMGSHNPGSRHKFRECLRYLRGGLRAMLSTADVTFSVPVLSQFLESRSAN
jgi:Glycosyl transferase family 2